MKKLLVMCQKVDESDDHRGFFIGWLREFGRNFDEISVITLSGGVHRLPPNVHVYSLGKERGAPKIVQAFRFYRYLARLLPGSVGIFAHASPIFIIASWPFTFLMRKKMILWYLHRSVTLKLKLSEFLCYRIVTADVESLGITSKKVVAVGHGIDTEKFKTFRNWDNSGTFKIVSVGRISPIKNYETLFVAVRKLKLTNPNFYVRIIGRPVMRGDNEYLDKLHKLLKQLGTSDVVRFAGFIPYGKIADEYKSADVVVGMTPHGGIDKAILEGMASGALVLTSNDAMKKYLGDYAEKLLFRHGDSDELAARIRFLIGLTPAERSEMSRFLVVSVSQHHALHNAVQKISQLFYLL